MPVWLLPLLQFLAPALQKLLGLFGNKTADEIGNGVGIASQLAIAILQETAAVQGVAIDWTDPVAVGNYVSTLPTFTPIPEPPAAPSAG
jgi:hypothetical protein